MKNKTKKQNKKVFFKLLQYIKPYSYKFIISLFLGLIATVCQVIYPRFLAKIINEFYNGISEMGEELSININFVYVFKIVILMISMCIFGNIVLYLQNIIMAKVSVDLTYKLRKEMDCKVNKLPIKYFDKVTNGEVLSRLTNDIDTMTSMLSRVVTHLFTAIITIVGMKLSSKCHYVYCKLDMCNGSTNCDTNIFYRYAIYCKEISEIF